MDHPNINASSFFSKRLDLKLTLGISIRPALCRRSNMYIENQTFDEERALYGIKMQLFEIVFSMVLRMGRVHLRNVKI